LPDLRRPQPSRLGGWPFLVPERKLPPDGCRPGRSARQPHWRGDPAGQPMGALRQYL
jgi:hypothetical protein